MPSLDPDHLDDDEPDDWQTAAAEHFTGDWRTHASQRSGPRTQRRPFTRSMNTDHPDTGEETEH
ncbi:hypothetical protein [Kocuria sp. KH4]